MKSPIDLLSLSSIAYRLKTKKFGKIIHYFRNVTSTMDIARQLAEKDEPEGSIVIAEEQDSGRGRFQRKWYSPSGGIYFSLILRPTISPSEVGKINLLAAVSLAETLKKLYTLPAKIKWPNDILVKERKISGILTEVRTIKNKNKWVILGIGINANTPIRNLDNEYIIPATSLKEELGKKISREKLLEKLLEHLEKEYIQAKKDNFAKVIRKWQLFSATLGCYVQIVTEKEKIEGKAVVLDEEGALVLELKNGERRKFIAGDCLHLR